MDDPKFDKRDNFVINDKYNDDEGQELDKEDYYDDHSGISRKKYFTPFTIGAAGLIVIVILFIIFLAGPKDVVDSKQLQSLESRIQQLEKRLASVDETDQNLEQYDKQEKKLNSISEKFDRFNSAISAQIDQIIKELSELHQKSSPPSAAKEKQATKTADTGRKETQAKFHTVRPEETLWGISRRYGLTVDQLRSYNKIGPKAAIQPGQKLKLTPN